MNNRTSKGRFLPGVSGNPNGRPKGTLREQIQKLMAEEFPEDRDGRTYLEVFVFTLVQLALRGHPHAIREVCGRMEGAIPQTIDERDSVGVPLIEVIWDRSDGPSGNVDTNGEGPIPPGLPPAE